MKTYKAKYDTIIQGKPVLEGSFVTLSDADATAYLAADLIALPETPAGESPKASKAAK